jgi:hypothetical protein
MPSRSHKRTRSRRTSSHRRSTSVRHSRHSSRGRSKKLTKSQEDHIFRNFIRNQLLKFGNDLKIPSVWHHPVTGKQVKFSDKAKRMYHELRKELGISNENPYVSGTPVKIKVADPDHTTRRGKKTHRMSRPSRANSRR